MEFFVTLRSLPGHSSPEPSPPSRTKSDWFRIRQNQGTIHNNPTLHSDAAASEDAPAAPAAPSYTCITKAEIMSEPNTIEFGSVWDPLGLAELGSDETLAWFRHAEVKHGRVAMAAFTGWAVVGAGLTLPGDLTREGLHFADIPKAGLAAWDAVPGIGKVQMLIFAGLIEFHDEIFAAKSKFGGDGHYLRGGVPGRNAVPGLYDPFGLSSKRSEAAKARGRSVEIKNGRLAMIGFMGLYAQAMIEGSVPFQPNP
ncbi:hypothetical protein TrRE_jg9388 [Triparma retinervis]|uniref:Chlorophyll a-b binding protein, chloroplastic n=1 Tax=Triparma retinervis TaxID=2557542 RepID=A0A9W7A2S2_9STRA|nr:hypothetical protein TrRE_jg9388 [Triparma retinervis]